MDGWRWVWSWEVQFEIRERGVIIRVPLWVGGEGRGVIEFSRGSATSKLITLQKYETKF